MAQSLAFEVPVAVKLKTLEDPGRKECEHGGTVWVFCLLTDLMVAS